VQVKWLKLFYVLLFYLKVCHKNRLISVNLREKEENLTRVAVWKKLRRYLQFQRLDKKNSISNWELIKKEKQVI